MSTRGTFGFYRGGESKLVYNHWDSYPKVLGDEMLEFIHNASGYPNRSGTYSDMIFMLNKIFDRLRPVHGSDAVPDAWCQYYSWYNSSCKGAEDWDDLLTHIANTRGSFLKSWLDPRPLEPEENALLNIVDSMSPGGKHELPVVCHFMENNGFITDSLYCEYGYVINLDTNVLELWIGDQRRPTYGNRYGTQNRALTFAGNEPYWPCLMIDEYLLDRCLADPATVLTVMMDRVDQYEKSHDEAEKKAVYDEAVALGIIKPRKKTNNK